MLELDIINGQWSLIELEHLHAFKKTHFYTALKSMHIHPTCGKRYARNI